MIPRETRVLSAVLFTMCLGVGCATQAVGEPSTIEDLFPASSEQALQWLIEGNERYRTGNPRHGHEELARRAKLADGQRPFAIILGCADSRVAPEIVFDHGLGDLFVIRVAGNVVAEDEAGSIEYAVNHLETKLVVVLGHESCGAVTAALDVPGDEAQELVTLLRRVRPALEGIDRSLPRERQVRLGVEANVRQSVRQLLEIADREGNPESERVLVVGAIYELDTGRVRFLDR